MPVALISGGLGDIGAAIARELAERFSAGIALGDIRPDADAEPLLRDLRYRGRQATYTAVDVTDADAVAASRRNHAARRRPAGALVRHAGRAHRATPAGRPDLLRCVDAEDHTHRHDAGARRIYPRHYSRAPRAADLPLGRRALDQTTALCPPPEGQLEG